MRRILKIISNFSILYISPAVRKVCFLLFLAATVCIGCQWQLKPADVEPDEPKVSIQRYDRIESLYLTTGDYSALQQMNTYYPRQTRLLLEDVLHLGQVDDPEIKTKFLHYFQDSTLQSMLAEVQRQYADTDDLDASLSVAFRRLREMLPSVEIPEVYAQIGSFDQSIIVGSNTLGISLDKYLGSDYPFYQSHYTPRQRSMMVRSMIVPDCLSFYILSLYPLSQRELQQPRVRDEHMGKIQWVVNHVMRDDIFQSDAVSAVSRLMKRQPMDIGELLNSRSPVSY